MALSLTNAQAETRVDKLCTPLKAFVASVKIDESKTIEFHTSWGSNFNDTKDAAIFAKRCIHYDFAPAKDVCTYLMEHGAVEFAGNNAKRALACLSPSTTFGPHVSLAHGEFDLSYGSEDRGSNVTIKFDEDAKIGGMVMTITANGY